MFQNLSFLTFDFKTRLNVSFFNKRIIFAEYEQNHTA
jgi:hypothetical protein